MYETTMHPTYNMSHLEKAEYYREKYLIASMLAAAGVLRSSDISYEVQAEACAKLVQFYEQKHKELEEDLTSPDK